MPIEQIVLEQLIHCPQEKKEDIKEIKKEKERGREERGNEGVRKEGKKEECWNKISTKINSQ